MISSKVSIIITFDEKGKAEIENAVYILREIVDAFEKVGGSTGGVISTLEDTECILGAILDKTPW